LNEPVAPQGTGLAGCQAPYVRSLFSTIADRYDLITRLLSYGQDRRWKARLATLSGARSGTRALDLARGTGDIAFSLAGRGAAVVGLDITPRMLQLARTTRGAAQFIAGAMVEACGVSSARGRRRPAWPFQRSRQHESFPT
jgi:ubiquinone/menaquinone biosynthesis C-methylase UbiE